MSNRVSSQSFQLRASSALALVLFLMLCVQADSRAWASPPPRIVAPASGKVVEQLPVAVEIDACRDKDLKVSLDGEDITSRFRISEGRARASLTRGVYVGDNRLKVTSREGTVEQHFRYLPPALPGMTGGAVQTTVPIQTQVVSTNTAGEQTNGVEVGMNIYPNPGPATDWHLLLLSRKDLSPVANNHYTLEPGFANNFNTFSSFLSDITPGSSLLSKCGEAGCLMILQGPVNNGGLGPYPCTQGNQPEINECLALQKALTSIGATNTATFSTGYYGSPSGMGYSFIGNVGRKALNAGVNYERVTCANASGCLILGVETPEDSNPTFISGLAPNGVDGVVPNLAGTADSGTSSIAATPFAPALTIYNNGAMGGNLLLDTSGNYTFAWSDPPIRFQMGQAPENANKHIVILQIPPAAKKRFPGNETTIAGESAALPYGQQGGFHLVVWDAVTFKNLANSTYVINPNNCYPSCSSPDGVPVYPLEQLETDLKNLPSRGNIWFLGSIGNLGHDFKLTSPDAKGLSMQDVWDRVAQSVQDLGGTYSTFAMLDNPALAQDDYDQYVNNKVPTDDDYNMVGQLWINASGVANPYATETSRAISRRTSANPVAGNMQGVLKRGHDGFYRAAQHSQYEGVLPMPSLQLFHASYLDPIPWPITGANDPAGPKNAFAYISEQVFNCATSDCDNIRAAYPNLNLKAEYLASRVPTAAPPDCKGPDNPCGFDQRDFKQAQTQILLELNELIPVQTLQENLTGTLKTSAPAFDDILTSVQDNVLSGIPTQSTLQIGPNTTDDLLNLLGDVTGFAGLIPEVGSGISASVNTGIGVYELATDDGTTINDPNGVSLQQQEQDYAEIASLANERLAQYTQAYTNIGVAFTRIESDWGRLQTAAEPLINNQVQYTDQGLGQYLTAYELSVRRSLYSSLIPFNYYAVHYRYADPGLNLKKYLLQPGWYYDSPDNNYNCYAWAGLPSLLANNPDSFGFWQGALIDGPGAPLPVANSNTANPFPFDAWWDVWFMGEKQPFDNLINSQGLYGNPGCPPTDPGRYLPTADFFRRTELFTPVGTDENALGFYKPWFMGRGPMIRQRANNTNTNWWYGHRVPYPNVPYIAGQNWAADPDNY